MIEIKIDLNDLIVKAIQDQQKPVAIPRSVHAALGQASFALRELLPDHPDAKLTVDMIKAAQAEITRIEGKA